jgi:ribosome-binding ATPase YchF (GTP1/OBG family)
MAMRNLQTCVARPRISYLHRYRWPHSRTSFPSPLSPPRSKNTQGASTGAGLGNAFLSHVRAVDGIFQMVRAFDDAEVIHVEGDVDPVRDMSIIQTELRLKDIEWTEKALENLKKTGRSLGSNSLADKARKEEIVNIQALANICETNVPSRLQWRRSSTF